jgi:hypothetical protein
MFNNWPTAASVRLGREREPSEIADFFPPVRLWLFVCSRK